jgi:hypothetical protein
MIPHHAGSRGAGRNSRGGRISTKGVSRTVCASKNAAIFSSGIDLLPALHVQTAKVGYHAIAQAESHKGI